MNVRRVLETDLEGIDHVLEQLMHGDHSRRRAIWPSLLNDRSFVAWVAVEGGTVVGFLDVLLWDDIAHGRMVGLVNNLIVDARVRGQGIGQSLLHEAIQYCNDQDVIELHVWTDTKNREAIGLCRKLGFADRGLLLELQVVNAPQ